MEASDLNSEFRQDYADFVHKFDRIYEDQFQGPKLESLASSFISKYRRYIVQVPFFIESKFPSQTTNETLDEDWRIITRPEKPGCGERPSEANRIVGDIYRRAAAAAYLRITLNKSRLDQEDDRAEAVDLSRYALRHNPDEPEANHWYMVTLGWQLKAIDGLKERMKVVKLFREITRRCIRQAPDNSYAHHLLGRYYLEVAETGWIQRAVAESVMGAKLDGSYADAEREFLEAHKLNSEWVPNSLFIAQTLLAQKRPSREARKWVELGLGLECKCPTSELERRRLLELNSSLRKRDV